MEQRKETYFHTIATAFEINNHMDSRSPKKYVLTGGPGVGKSAMIDIFVARGYSIVPETARMVIEEEQARNSDILPWRDLLRFQEVVARKQLEAEMKICEQEVFLDRGIVDGYAYCKQGNIPAPKNLIDNARGRYDAVFLLAPLAHYENDHVRKEDKEFQAVIHALIEEAYRKFGYDIIHVPALHIHERAEFILKIIKKDAL